MLDEKLIASIPDELLDNHGFTVPFYGVVIDRFANLEAMHYVEEDGQLTPHFVAEHIAAGSPGMAFPMVFVFMDSATGDAVFTIIAADQARDGGFRFSHPALVSSVAPSPAPTEPQRSFIPARP